MTYSHPMREADRISAASGEPPRPVAQYLRMSSEHQRYSLANQKAAMQEYAEARNLIVVKSYLDPAKSGLTLRKRKGLQKLISDSVQGNAPFKEVLVYDVSRWGRFQDHDESATYEFLCRSAGVGVRYCFEPFDNDGSPMSAIMKHIKRVMAADYSAALSERIHRAQLYQARLGFKQGGSMTYGVRRMLVDKDGNLRFLLDHGERKGLQTDRVIYVPGPDEELETVRRIFRMFVTERRSIPAIAKQLNAEGVIGARGKPWNFSRVRYVLANELFIGNYVYNRTTRKLQNPTTRNPPEAWLRVKVMDPVVSPRIFHAAAKTFGANRGYGYHKKDMLKALKRLVREGQPLTTKLIDQCPYTPTSVSYTKHFGCLKNAFDAISYVKPNFTWKKRPRRGLSNEHILAGLRRIHAANGYITGSLISMDLDLPHSGYIRVRFGSLLKAYDAAGLTTTRSQVMIDARARAKVDRPVWGSATA